MLTIRLLGTPTFAVESQALTPLIAGRAAALLSYLAVTRQPQPRALLTDLLWQDTPEQQARTNLRYLLSNLRKVVGDYVVAQGESVAFNQELPHWVDVTAFTTHLSTVHAATTVNLEAEILQALLNLYTGEFMAGFQVEEALLFERWLLTQRRHLHDLLVQGLRLRTQQHLEQSEYAEGLVINHYLLTLEPWREEAHQQRMLLLAHSGQRSAALQQYTRCCQVLAEELDVPPMPQTTTLYEQIKSGQWFAAQATPGQRQPLPVAIPAFPVESLRHRHNGATPGSASPSAPKDAFCCDLGAMPEAAHFAGRHGELATLHSWVGQEQSRLVALLGLNGQGKTALAAAFVQDVIEDEQKPRYGFTQVIWRSLHGAPACTDLLQGWLQQLDAGQDVLASSFDELVTRLFAILQTRRCLLVLDGVEEILTAPTSWVDARNADAYRPGCEAYAMLLHLFFQRRHRGCLLLTSRIRPAVLSPLEERNGAFHCLEVEGLTLADGAALLAALRIGGDSATMQQLHCHYAGNPRLLYQAANLIYELFGSDAPAFLQEEVFFLGDIGAALRQQLTTLPALKQQMLQRLAQLRQPVSHQTLYDQLSSPPAKSDYFRGLQRLQRAFLLRQTGEQVELPALVAAYLAEHSLTA